MLFTQRLKEGAQSHPESLAVLDGALEISYRELMARAQRLATVIAVTTTGQMIGVLMSKSADYIVSIVAIHLAGRTVVPLDSSYPAERLKQMIASIELSLCLLNQQRNIDLTAMLSDQTRVLFIDEPTPDPVTVNGSDLPPSDLSETPAYVVFTSGTTGNPKPVMMPYRSLSSLVDWMEQAADSVGTTLLYAAQGFDVSFQEIYSALCYGNALLVITDEEKKDLHQLTRYMVEKSVSRLFLPTSMLIPFVTFSLHASRALENLQEVICAGEQLKIAPAVRQWFKAHPDCRLINHYGPAETHVVMVHALDGEVDAWPDLPPIGRITPGSAAYLLDEQLQPVTSGIAGQLYVAGSSLALGYFNMPSQTSERFVTHPQTGERMYNTGDICLLNELGLFEYKGRNDRQYKVRGYRVELNEIEAAVADSGLVGDCLVVPRQSGKTTSLILYFTAPAHGQDISMSLHAHLAEKLPEYMLPSFYKKIAAIPLTQNGKADMASLPQVGGRRSQVPSAYIAPRGELETLVCTLAAACVGLDQMGADDNFMEVGANSITLISLLAELRYALAHDFRQTDLFEYPTPRFLCAKYQRDRDVSTQDDTVAPANHPKLRAAAIHNVQGRKRG